MRSTTLALIAQLLTLSTPPVAAQSVPRIVESVNLGSLDNAGFTIPEALNNRGDIVGRARNAQGVDIAFLWTRQRGFEPLVENASALDINERGDVVGWRFVCDDEDCHMSGFLWDRRNGLQDLRAFTPFAISNRGDMAGRCESMFVAQACVVRDGVLIVLGHIGLLAQGINHPGDVVGVAPDNRAFLWTAKGIHVDLGNGVARKINERGDISGHRFVDGRGVVTAWLKQNPVSPVLVPSVSAGINARGWVIANAWDENEDEFSFAWNPANNARVMLDSAAGGLARATDINDAGDVVGVANYGGEGIGDWRVVIWQLQGHHLNGPGAR